MPTVTFLLPDGMHHIEAWSDAVTAGAWGKRLRGLGEKARITANLDHWACFQDSFRKFEDLVIEIAGGRACIQSITIDDALFERYAASTDFIQAYIFPGGCLISESRFRALAEERGLVWRDVLHFGLGYAETLRQWRERFDAAVSDGRLPAGFDDRFVRLWRYYLMYCEGGFRGGTIDVASVPAVETRFTITLPAVGHTTTSAP